jgi:hypothetical protein
MIYRGDLIEHYDWLAGSRYLDEFLDESVGAIAMTAHGHGGAWVRPVPHGSFRVDQGR